LPAKGGQRALVFADQRMGGRNLGGWPRHL
jgi:hypothetical protein